MHRLQGLIVWATQHTHTHCLGCKAGTDALSWLYGLQAHCLGYPACTNPLPFNLACFCFFVPWRFCRGKITYDSVYRRFVLAIQPTRSHVFVTQTLCFGCTDYTDSLSLRYSQHRLMPSLHSLRRLTGLAIQSQTHVLASIQHRLMSWLRSHLTIHCTSSAVLTLHQPSTTVMF